MTEGKVDFAILQNDKTKSSRVYHRDKGWSPPLPVSDWELLCQLHKAMRESNPDEFLVNLQITVSEMKKDDLEG
jgi:hypothetical protein